MWLDTLITLKKTSRKTIKQISDESGVPIGTLNKLFAGQTKDPKLDTIRSVVHALGYTLDDLEDTPQKKSPSADESAPEDNEIFRLFDALNDMLISSGLIKEGGDITRRQSEVLIAVCRIIDATFND